MHKTSPRRAPRFLDGTRQEKLAFYLPRPLYRRLQRERERLGITIGELLVFILESRYEAIDREGE